MSNDYKASRIVGALPPPPGVTPNFDNPSDHIPNMIALQVVCLTVVTLFVAMRISVRTLFVRQFGFGLDDCFIIIAWALSVALCGLVFKAMTLGAGRHLWDVPKSQVSLLGEWLYILAIELLPAWLFVKLAFFWSYKRVFGPSKTMKWLCYGGAFVCTCLYVAQVFHDIFICIPVQKDWNPTIKGHCLPSGVGGSVTAIFNVISDLYIFLIPLPFVWKLQMKRSARIRLVLIFSLGAIVNAFSIVRLALTYAVANDKDVTWKFFEIAALNSLELNVGIICVCSLVFPAFWDRVVSSKWIKLRTKSSSTFDSHDFQDSKPTLKSAKGDTQVSSDV